MDCSWNDLTSLPALPGRLEYLECDEGLLDGVELPQSLRTCEEVRGHEAEEFSGEEEESSGGEEDEPHGGEEEE